MVLPQWWGRHDRRERLCMISLLHTHTSTTPALARSETSGRFLLLPLPYSHAISHAFPQAHTESGFLGYKPTNKENIAQELSWSSQMTKTLQRASNFAPDFQRRALPLFLCIFFGTQYCRHHTLPEFDKELFVGPGGCLCYASVQSYDFTLMHSFSKSRAPGFDFFLLGGQESALVLWYGDLPTARAGWSKLIEAWKKIEGLVQSGERSWAEYFHEAVLYGPMASSAIMMLAGETSMVREIVSHSFVHIALGDSFVAAELEKVMNSSSFFWKVFLSLCHSLPPLHSLPPPSFRSPHSISL